MKTKEKISELIFDEFRKVKARANHIVMMSVFYHKTFETLNPKEQDLFSVVVNELIVAGYLLYQKDSPEYLRLTEKGFHYIYDSKPIEINIIDKLNITNMDINPLKILKEAINKVPFVKYALGITGIVAAIAIIKSFAIENYSIPIISILIMLGFMIVLFVFSSISKSKEKHIKNAGYLLIYTAVGIVCISSILLASSVFFDYPKSIAEYSFFKTDTIKTIVQKADSTINESSKIHNENNPIINGNGNTLIINQSTPNSTINTNTSLPNKKNSGDSFDIKKKGNQTGKTKIAILPFENISSINKYDWLSKGIPESLLKSISSIEKYIVIEGNLRDKILREIDFQQGKYIDIKSAVKIGKLLGSQEVIIGSYQINNEKIEISSRIVDVESGQINKKSIVTHSDSISDIFQMEKNYAQRVLNKLNEND